MGVKKVLPSFNLFTATTGIMTGTSTIVSAATNIQNLDNVGIQVSWTGTPVGVVSVLCSVDGVSYYALTFSPALAAPAGSATGMLVSLNQVPFNFVKVSYTNTSSTGVLSAFITGKDIN